MTTISEMQQTFTPGSDTVFSCYVETTDRDVITFLSSKDEKLKDLYIIKDIPTGCEFYKDGCCCRCESNEEELSREILKLNEELRIARSDNTSLKNMIVKMCYDRFGE